MVLPEEEGSVGGGVRDVSFHACLDLGGGGPDHISVVVDCHDGDRDVQVGANTIDGTSRIAPDRFPFEVEPCLVFVLDVEAAS